jgi:diguanylate cyclase (GGDEF)-like protein
VRGEDITCRYGGDEFAFALLDIDAPTALRRADLLREGVKGLRVSYKNKPLSQVSLSIGLAAYPDHGKSLDALLKAAETALYRAKAAGGDQIAVAPLDDGSSGAAPRPRRLELVGGRPPASGRE